MPYQGKKESKKMNREQEMVTVLQGKAVREFAQRLVTGKYAIEQLTLNRYKVIGVYDGPGNDYTLIDRRSFVLLDKEIYRLQAKENPLAAGIEKALDNNALQFYVRKASIDALSIKLIARTFSLSKVNLENVTTYLDNYVIRFSLVESVSERSLTEREKAIAAMFQRAEEVNLDPESLQLPPAETAQAVDTTAKEIPAK